VTHTSKTANIIKSDIIQYRTVLTATSHSYGVCCFSPTNVETTQLIVTQNGFIDVIDKWQDHPRNVLSVTEKTL